MDIPRNEIIYTSSFINPSMIRIRIVYCKKD